MLMSYVCDMDGVIYHGSRLIPVRSNSCSGSSLGGTSSCS